MRKNSAIISNPPFYFIPALHYTMEVAVETRLAFLEVHPDCVAVELPSSLQREFLQATSRLPDISAIITENDTSIYLIEPCDASLEALRSALEAQIPGYCIDLAVKNYPEYTEPLPDPYAIYKIGLDRYYHCYQQQTSSQQDQERELYMAQRLKELSFSYEKILVVVGMQHIAPIMKHIHDTAYPKFTQEYTTGHLVTVPETSAREIVAEYGWITHAYEIWRREGKEIPNRQQLIYQLLKASIEPYELENRTLFPKYALATLMHFARNYAHLHGQLLPNLFQLLASAKSCVDHNYAYEVWKQATDYPYLRNIDNLPERALTIEEVWGKSKKIHFHPRQKSKKNFQDRLRKDRNTVRFFSPSPFGICSHTREDTIIEAFGSWLKKRGIELHREEGIRTIPFSTSLEDGIDTRETIRHFAEKQLYVKTSGKPVGEVGSLVVIFDEENLQRYPWRLSWVGEHEQESDMAFYATSLGNDIIGPGIARCEYGGFLLSYPPRRLLDVWSDPDYADYTLAPEVLLAAAIDYSMKPLIVYVGPQPPRTVMKQYAARFGKRILYIPLTQFSPLTMKKLRIFHVLNGHHTRLIADDYIH